MARANVELRQIAGEITWGDLDAYVRRVEARDDGAKVRESLARHLDPMNVIVIQVEPAP
jgi:hypothetical protein